MMRKTLAGAVLATSLVFSSCAGTPPPKSEAGSDTFTYAWNLDEVMVGWDPATAYSSEIIAMNNIYEQLTRYDAETKTVEPLLATKWTTSPDGLTWTFTLRQDVEFSTGRPFDAASAKAAIMRTKELGAGAGHIWDPVTSIETPAPDTLVFRLEEPAPLDLITSSGYAAYMYDTKATDGDLAAWFEEGNAAGTGPYVVQSWAKGQQVELKLTANKDYWDGWDGDHYERVVYQVVPEATTASQLLRAGDVSFVSRLPSDLLEAVESDDRVAVSNTPSFQNLLSMLNTASGPLEDERVRTAVQSALDLDAIAHVLNGSVIPSSGIVPEGLIGFDDSLGLSQDLDASRAALAEAGYGPGKPLRLTATYQKGDADIQQVTTLMKSQLAEVGIELDVRAHSWTTIWDLAKSKDVSKRQDIFLFYWWPDYPDAYSWFLNLFRSSKEPYYNLSYWNDPATDAAIDRLPALTATDREAAEEAYRTLQSGIKEQAVAIPMYVQNYQRALSADIDGYVDNPAYPNVVFAYELSPTG